MMAAEVSRRRGKTDKLHANGLPARVYDFLSIDGGRWTTRSLAAKFGVSMNTMRAALYRLEATNRVVRVRRATSLLTRSHWSGRMVSALHSVDWWGTP